MFHLLFITEEQFEALVHMMLSTDPDQDPNEMADPEMADPEMADPDQEPNTMFAPNVQSK